MKNNSSAWLDRSHPNFSRWLRARELSLERGRFVQSIVGQLIGTENLSILDLGSGEGGTSAVFSGLNFVVSFDISLLRLRRQTTGFIPDYSGEDPGSSGLRGNPVNGTAVQLPFKDSSFDLIIVQDVIEHLSDTGLFCKEIKRILKPKGILFISTPNKLSVINFLGDPHFGLPVISVLKRESIKKYFLRLFRKNDYYRSDIAQLLSLDQLVKLFEEDFAIFLNTKYSVRELFNGNEGIVWSDFHIRLVRFIRFLRLNLLIAKIANDKAGSLNKYITPTFYLTLRKK